MTQPPTPTSNPSTQQADAQAQEPVHLPRRARFSYRQQEFVRHVAAGYEPKKAAILAGYAESTAVTNSARLLAHPRVAVYIRELTARDGSDVYGCIAQGLERLMSVIKRSDSDRQASASVRTMTGLLSFMLRPEVRALRYSAMLEELVPVDPGSPHEAAPPEQAATTQPLDPTPQVIELEATPTPKAIEAPAPAEQAALFEDLALQPATGQAAPGVHVLDAAPAALDNKACTDQANPAPGPPEGICLDNSALPAAPALDSSLPQATKREEYDPFIDPDDPEHGRRFSFRAHFADPLKQKAKWDAQAEADPALYIVNRLLPGLYENDQAPYASDSSTGVVSEFSLVSRAEADREQEELERRASPAQRLQEMRKYH